MFRQVTAAGLRQIQSKTSRPAAVALAIPSSAPVVSRSFSKSSLISLTRPAQREFVTPPHVKGDVTTIAIAVAAILGAAGVGKIWWDASSSTGVTKDALASYFNELATIVEELVAQLPQLTEAVMQQARASGQKITEAQVRSILVERLGQAIQMADQDLAKKFKFTQEAIEVAMLELQETPEVQAAIHRLQTAIENSPLGETAEVPEDLTASRTLEVMSEVLKAVSRAMTEALDEAKKAGMKDVNLEGHLWQENYMQKTYEYTAEVHEKYGVSEPILNAAITKYNEDLSFQAQLQALLEKHQTEFQQMGLQV